jgi:hypothetical protein
MMTLNKLLTPALLALAFAAFAETFSFQADDVKLKDSYLKVGRDITYPVVMRDSPRTIRRRYRQRTTCYDDENREITCQTLFSVGYIDRAAITVLNGAVRTIRVEKLLQ